MTYTKVNYTDVEPVGEGLHFLREPLECEQLGISVLDCDPGWEGTYHDHADDGHEEVYVLLEGDATIEFEDDAVALSAGDAIRVPAETGRKIRNGDVESRFVIAGAP